MERIRRSKLGRDLMMLVFYPMRAGLNQFAEKVLPKLRRQRGTAA